MRTAPNCGPNTAIWPPFRDIIRRIAVRVWHHPQPSSPLTPLASSLHLTARQRVLEDKALHSSAARSCWTASKGATKKRGFLVCNYRSKRSVPIHIDYLLCISSPPLGAPCEKLVFRLISVWFKELVPSTEWSSWPGYSVGSIFAWRKSPVSGIGGYMIASSPALSG